MPRLDAVLRNAAQYKLRWFKLGIVILLTGLVVASAWAPLQNAWNLLNDREAVQASMRRLGPWGPVLLAVVQFLQVIIAAIPGQPFMVAAGYSYGFLGGLLINLVSTVAASQVAFVVARRAGRPVVTRVVPEPLLDCWLEKAERGGFLFLVAIYLVPIFPADTMNFVAGLSGISPRRFLAASLLGRLPGVVLATLLGSHGLELSPRCWALIAGIAGCTAGLYIAWRHLKANRSEPEPPYGVQ